MTHVFARALRTPSAVMLLIANAIPLVGVSVLGWSIFDIFLLFWLETAVIGVYNALRLAVVAGRRALFLIPFFTVHFGIFMVVHLVFIVALFGAASVDLGGMGSRIAHVRTAFTQAMMPLIAYAVSHGYSFVTHFIRHGEYRSVKANEQMMAPYARVVLMHVTIIIGGMLAFALGASVVALALLVILKTALDLVAHLRSHERVGIRV